MSAKLYRSAYFNSPLGQNTPVLSKGSFSIAVRRDVTAVSRFNYSHYPIDIATYHFVARTAMLH